MRENEEFTLLSLPEPRVLPPDLDGLSDASHVEQALGFCVTPATNIGYACDAPRLGYNKTERFIRTGFDMRYGVFQEHYFDNWTVEGDRSVTGVVDTTANGIMYISMPLLSALSTRQWAH